MNNESLSITSTSLCLPVATPSAGSSSTIRAPSQDSASDVQILQNSDGIQFGTLVEEGLAGLGLEESVVLKIKLISVIAEEKTWVGKFEKLGLSRSEATLLSILFKSESGRL